MNIAIIGGGASGVLTALRIKKSKPEYDITIYEASNRLLHKVSLSGAGKCNISNINIEPNCYTDGKIISYMLNGYQNEALNFLQELGLMITIDEKGRVYPRGKEAKAFVRLLTNKLFYEHINVLYNKRIENLVYHGDKVFVENKEYDYVVIAIGSNAAISNSLAHYNLVKEYALENLKPGLVGFKVNNLNPKLNGIRCKVDAYYLNKKASGEMIFKSDGVSGICLMDLSLFYDKQKSQELILDLLPDKTLKELLEYACWRLKCDENIHLYSLLQTALPDVVLNIINNNFKNQTLKDCDEVFLINYFNAFKEYKLIISDTYDFLNSQVTVGGVSLNEVKSFQAYKHKNTYLVGEVLAEAGICGGYNLWFAITSAIMVGDMLCK